MHMTSKKLCALLTLSLSTIVLSSDQRTEQRRQRLERRNEQQQEREEQALQQAQALALRQAKVEAESAKRKRIAQKAETLLLTAIVKLVPARLPRQIDATQNCTICQEGLQETACPLVETACEHFFHEACMSSFLSHLPQGANQSQRGTQKCPNCYTVIRTLGAWDVKLECRKGPFSEPQFKRYKAE